MSVLADRIRRLGTENAFKIGDDIARCEQMGREVIRLNLGEPDFNSADNINQVAIDHITRGNSHYTNPQGIPSLRNSIARQIAETRNIDADPNRIVVTTGAKPPIAYTMLTYVNPGDEVIYPSPGFPIYESWVTFVGGTPKPLHLSEDRGFRFTPEELAGLITPKTKVLIINSPSNPTGGVFTRNDMEGIARVVREKASPDLRIYSDEVYEHILFDGHKHQSIASLDGMAERTILVSGHSKSYAMTGWRLGYAMLPTVEETLVFRQLNINIISCTPPFVQEAGREALDNPMNEKIIAGMTAEFQKRRDVVVEGLNRINGIRCQKPQGAFYVFPNIAGACEKLGILEYHEKLPMERKNKTSPSVMFQMFALYRHGVAAMDRNSFGSIGAEGQHYLRLSTATDMESLKEGVRRIESAASDRDGCRAFLDEKKYY
jgi:aspartate aminotransferase